MSEYCIAAINRPHVRAAVDPLDTSPKLWKRKSQAPPPPPLSPEREDIRRAIFAGRQSAELERIVAQARAELDIAIQAGMATRPPIKESLEDAQCLLGKRRPATRLGE